MQSTIEELADLHLKLLSNFFYNYSDENKIFIDLVTIMGSIYREDVLNPKKDLDKRVIELNIPVFYPQIWCQVSENLTSLVQWVSKDIFLFEFVPLEESWLQFNNLIPLENKGNIVTLFSGGLDSLSGAYSNYVNKIKSDYVGFKNKGEEGNVQEQIKRFYKKKFGNNTDIILIPKLIKKKINLTQSTRSLLYLALAIAKANLNSTDKVFLYENGVLSLNPELNNRFTTKTTHPKTIYLYQCILERVGIYINIVEPFKFKTKGEIINDMDSDFKSVINQTFTCGAGRSALKSHKGQCGICVPCLLRKISLAAYDNENFDTNYHYPYDTKINQIHETLYRNDYESNLHYFRQYHDKIKNEEIFVEIETRDKYYKGEFDHRKKIKAMLDKFAEEYERFISKYAPY